MRSWRSLWFGGLSGGLPHLSLSELPQKARRHLQIHGFSSQKHLFFSSPWPQIVSLGKHCRCWAKSCAGKWLQTRAAHLQGILARSNNGHSDRTARLQLPRGSGPLFPVDKSNAQPLAHCEPGMLRKGAGTQEAGGLGSRVYAPCSLREHSCPRGVLLPLRQCI